MFNPAQFYEAGRVRSGTAFFPIFDTTWMSFELSTRLGNAEIDKGDGTAKIPITTQKNFDFATGTPTYTPIIFTYSSAFTGNFSIIFKGGLMDVYSLKLGVFHQNTNGTNTEAKWNILDVETFFKQFPNLYSILINEYAYQTGARMPVIKGDLAKLPDSVERLLVQYTEVIGAGSGELYFNFSNYSSTGKIKFLSLNPSNSSYPIKIIGDISKLPVSANYIWIGKALAGSIITYTAGKVWASAFDTLYLPIGLSVTETDNLLIDLNNSITTAIGAKSVTLQGYRSSASDSAVAGLIAKGFAVNCVRISSINLELPLSTNLLDTTTYANHATMVGTETHASSGLQTSTGNYAYIPNKTSLDIGTGSIAFGCKVKFNSVTSFFGIVGKTIAGSAVGRYGIFVESGLIYGLTQITSGTISNTISVTAYNDGNFHSIEVICNRTTGLQSLKIDGITVNTQSFTPSSDNLARNARFIMGAYGDVSGTGTVASSELNGIIKDAFVYKF